MLFNDSFRSVKKNSSKNFKEYNIPLPLCVTFCVSEFSKNKGLTSYNGDWFSKQAEPTNQSFEYYVLFWDILTTGFIFFIDNKYSITFYQPYHFFNVYESLQISHKYRIIQNS